jgi:IS6 family transposase
MSNGSWRVDETYVRVKGRRTYLYRAVDSRGRTIDFLLAAHAANPRTLTVDKNPAYPRAVAEMKSDGQLSRRTCLRQCKYLTDVFDKGLPRPHGGRMCLTRDFPARMAD